MDIFRKNELSSPQIPQGSKSSFLPNIKKASRENSRMEDAPRALPSFEELPNIEIRGRLRELELQMLDLRSGVERRLSSVSEDFPNRLNKELRVIQERDSYLWKESTQKQTALSESLTQLQKNIKLSFEYFNTELVTVRRKVEEISIQHSSTVREVEHISKMPRMAIEAPQPADISPLLHSFKEAINEERAKRESMQNEHNMQIQELHMLLRNSYIEHGRRLQEYRDQIMMNHSETHGQLVSLEATKEEKSRNDQEYMKTVIGNLQKRLEDEVVQRNQVEKEYKMWTDSKLNVFQKMMKSEEKNLADREGKILGMMQEGLSALHEIITRVKETSSASLTKVQSMTNENLKELAGAVSSIKDSLNDKIDGLEFAFQEETRARVEQNSSMINHIQNIIEGIERQKTNTENQIMSTENRLRSNLYEIQQEMISKEEQMTNWKTSVNDHLEQELENFRHQLEKLSKDWEAKYRDSKDQVELALIKSEKMKIELTSSVDQVKNAMSFEDNLIEQRVNNAVNSINDKLDREIKKISTTFEKTLANITADNAASLALRIEQLQKLSQDQIKSAVLEETKLRKAESQSIENLIKHRTDTIYSKLTETLSREISEISEKLYRAINEEDFVKGELVKIRNETASSIEQLFVNLDEMKERMQGWTESYTVRVMEGAKDEFKVMVDVEREVILKEIDKAKADLKGMVEENTSQFNKNFHEEALLTKRLESEISKQKELRAQEVGNAEKRIEGIMQLMQEAISQSSEAVKAVCRALVTKEAAERNQSQESIIKSLSARMVALEDLLKFYTSKSAEEIRAELVQLIENEKNARNQAELAQNQQNKKLKNQVKAHKDYLEVELAMQSMLDSVVQSNTMNLISASQSSNKKDLKALKAQILELKDHIEVEFSMNRMLDSLTHANTLSLINQSEVSQKKLRKLLEAQLKSVKDEIDVQLTMQQLLDSVAQENTLVLLSEQKSSLEEALKKWVNSFEKDLEDTNIALSDEVANVRQKLEEEVSHLHSEITSKVEVRNAIDSMISLIEKNDTNEGIRETQGNIEVMFRNIQKLEQYLVSTKEEIREEIERNKDEIVKEIGRLEQKEEENNEGNHERIEIVTEKIELIEKADHQKAINILMDQITAVKEDLYNKQDTMSEIRAKLEEVENKQAEILKAKAAQEEDLQSSIKILVDSNKGIEKNLSQIQKEIPEMMEKLHSHQDQIEILMKEKES